MEKTLGAFKAQQCQALKIMEKLHAFLEQGESVGIKIDLNLKAKLHAAIQGVTGEKLKIALIGGFSEGKTSIAAAWMERLDKSSMKISHQESSNEVKVYDVGPDLVLIDTPGLFGFKEHYSDKTHSIEKYKDITKKYVSEAHLILYVMNSTNPIKESHKEDLVWLFRTLNLLPRTVFVLSRFDEVADVEDEREYEENLKVKRDNVVGRLQDLIGLEKQEVAELAIIAVAANPFDMGMDHWLSNLGKFKALSHIALLQAATSEKVTANGGALNIIVETQRSIIRDVLTKQMPIAVANAERIDLEVNKLNTMSVGLKKQLDSTDLQISDVRVSLRQFVTDYFSDLILQAKGLSLGTFSEFFEREVGENGIVLATRLQNEFDRQLRSVSLEVSNMEFSLETEINHFNATVKLLGKQGLDYVVKSNLITNTSVLATRDGIVSASKMIGIDLSKLLKFKPHGAANLAKGITGALAALGLALEAWETWEQAKREEDFRKAIDKMVENFMKQRGDVLELITGPQFINQFFSNYIELQKSVIDVQQCVERQRKQSQQLHAWRQMGETIDAEFTEVNAA
jgi:GTP-binding protein EngB required for normal cell division